MSISDLTGPSDSTTDFPFPPGVQYDPGIQAFDPFIAPASYNVQDQIASPSLRGQMQQAKHDSRMTALSPLVKGLQRGFICQDPNLGKGFRGQGLRRFQFLFNPSTVVAAYQSNGDITDPGNTNDPGASLPAPNAQGGVVVSLSLLLDRTYETWSNKQNRGVMEDVHQLEKMCGWSPGNPWLQIANYMHLFLGPYQHFYGRITDFTVTYTNWTQYLVPNRASLDVDIRLYPDPADRIDNTTGSKVGDTTTPTGSVVSPGDSAALTQTFNQQVPSGSPTGQYSDNGYPASKNVKDIQATAHTVPDATLINFVLNDAVAPLLMWAALQWNAHVEYLLPGQCGGYDFRPNVNNPSVLSNHSSGTAIDLNSLVHPNNTDPTANFSGPQIAYIRNNIIAPSGGCLRWGGDYHGIKDGMHIEINAPIGQVLAQIKAMNLTPSGVVGSPP